MPPKKPSPKKLLPAENKTHATASFSDIDPIALLEDYDKHFGDPSFYDNESGKILKVGGEYYMLANKLMMTNNGLKLPADDAYITAYKGTLTMTDKEATFKSTQVVLLRNDPANPHDGNVLLVVGADEKPLVQSIKEINKAIDNNQIRLQTIPELKTIRYEPRPASYRGNAWPSEPSKKQQQRYEVPDAVITSIDVGSFPEQFTGAKNLPAKPGRKHQV